MTQVARIEPELPAAPTPMAMIERAVASGASIDTISKLMDLQDRWESNQARKAFDEAVSCAKAEIPPIAKNREGHNNKRYADFAAIARVVDPILAKHGLSYRFRTSQTDTRVVVTCILAHRAGHSEESTLAGPPDSTGSKNAIQAIGSTLTYLQRYSLVQALGLAASEDDDGQKGGAVALTEVQVDQITALITETGADIGRFLKWAQAESVSDIPASKFDAAVAMLQAKRGAKK